ncbi:SOS response-associated peptidase [Oenococcus sicerae]|uniref:Abasic site processing protein n=1 Tax=Oenococcus sicerae TaxID=2203724 RepID=A0ABX5QKT3_9LACO|nr:SOS response-associated peptidase family protein [Oenococcus sicerae]QAS69297.1 SOS response-associated peptidase [Oenococcus sicerae]
MCGRYLFQPNDLPEMQKINQLALENGYQFKTGEIFPTDHAALIIAGSNQVQVVSMAWGFPGFKAKQTLINARAETVLEKPIFADAFQQYRCVYPTTGFFEWTADKEKTYFNYRKETSALYIAGFYDFFNGEAKSILLTTAANPSVAAIHDRMPLILKKSQIKRWIYDLDFAESLLHGQMPELTSQGI